MYRDTWTERDREFREGFKMKNPSEQPETPTPVPPESRPREAAVPAPGGAARTLAETARTALSLALARAFRAIHDAEADDMNRGLADERDIGRRVDIALPHVIAFAAPPPPQPTAADAGGRGERRWGVMVCDKPDGPERLFEHLYDRREAAENSGLGRVCYSARVVPVLVTVLPAGGDTGAAGAEARDVANDLHRLAMNVRADPDKAQNQGDASRAGYLYGHRDARHDIAELIVGHGGLRRLGERLAAAERERERLHGRLADAEEQNGKLQTALSAAERERDGLRTELNAVHSDHARALHELDPLTADGRGAEGEG